MRKNSLGWKSPLAQGLKGFSPWPAGPMAMDLWSESIVAVGARDEETAHLTETGNARFEGACHKIHPSNSDLLPSTGPVLLSLNTTELLDSNDEVEMLQFTYFLKLHQFPTKSSTPECRETFQNQTHIHIAAHPTSPTSRQKEAKARCTSHRPDPQKLPICPASFSLSSDSFVGGLQAALKVLVEGGKSSSIILRLHWLRGTEKWLFCPLLLIWNFPLG